MKNFIERILILFKIGSKPDVVSNITTQEILTHPNSNFTIPNVDNLQFENPIETAIVRNDLVALLEIKDFSYKSYFGDTAFHLIGKHSRNHDFFKKAFEHVLKYSNNYKELNENKYNIVDCLLVNNMRFYLSDLILSLEYLEQYFKVEESISTRDFYHYFFYYRDYQTCHISGLMTDEIKRIMNKNVPVKLCQELSIESKAGKTYPAMQIWFRYKHIFEADDLSQICNSLVESDAKKMKKLYIEKVINGSMNDIMVFELVNLFIKNYDLKIEYINEIILKEYKTNERERMERMRKIISFFKSDAEYLKLKDEISDYNSYRLFLKPFVESYKYERQGVELVNDTIRMYFEFKRKTKGMETEIVINFADFKDIKAMHDWLSIEIRKINVREFKFDNETYQNLDGISFNFEGVDYVMKLPKTNYDIITLGATLHICIGSDYYINKHLNKESVIFLLFKNDEIHGAVDCNKDLTVREAKLYANRPFPQQMVNKMHEALIVRNIEKMQ